MAASGTAAIANRSRIIPGFGLTLGFTLFWLGLIVLLPLAGLVLKTMNMGWPAFVATVTDPRVIAAFKVSFGVSFIAALVNVLFGLIVAWTLVRYRFPGRRIMDAVIDLPFA